MANDTEPFRYCDDFRLITKPDDWIAIIPERRLAKEAIFTAFQSSLAFPNYFGWNWDAFEECLNDLNWIAARRVLIVHRDLPLEGSPKHQRAYLNILRQAAMNPRTDGGQELIVTFPTNCKSIIEGLRT